MCRCVGTRVGRYRLIWIMNLPPCSVSVSTKCLCHSIWLAALQTACVSTGMKHTIIPPRWLGWFFFYYYYLSVFLMWETFSCYCSGLHLSDRGLCIAVEPTDGITEQWQTPKPQRILDRAASLRLCSNSSITGVALCHTQQPWTGERMPGRGR